MVGDEAQSNPHLGRNAIGCGSKIRFEDLGRWSAGCAPRNGPNRQEVADVSGSRPRAAWAELSGP